MFDRSVLFVGAEGVGVGILAEAMALDYARKSVGGMPLRVFSATTSEAVQSDPVMVRAMQRLGLDISGLSMKPLALFAFDGAPKLDHVILLGSTLPPAVQVALNDSTDVRTWTVDVEVTASQAPGDRYGNYMAMADALRSPIHALVDELTSMDAVPHEPFAHIA